MRKERVRKNSTIQNQNIVTREFRDNRWIYVKQYGVDTWDATPEVIQNRLALELRTIERMKRLERWHPRIGRLNVLESNSQQGLIITEQVTGVTLTDWVHNEYRPAHYPAGLRLFNLAGRWVRLFQQLEVTNVELRAAGNRNPADMCEYLKIRLQALLETGYRGISATLGERILQKTRELGQRFDTHDCGLVMCHNDYSIGNIVTDGQGITPIDFQMTAPGFSLLDVAYFLHRLEMARIYRPWLMRPWRQWRQAFIAGYGRLDLLSSPLYKALLLRLYVIRLLTYAKQQPSSMKQRVHRKWVLAIVRSRLLRELNS